MCHHVSCVTFHVSHVICNMSHVTFCFVFTNWWSLLVEGLSLTGPTPSSFWPYKWSPEILPATTTTKILLLALHLQNSYLQIKHAKKCSAVHACSAVPCSKYMQWSAVYACRAVQCMHACGAVYACMRCSASYNNKI